MATMFGFGGCTQPTGGDDGITDPYHIGRHGGIVVRVAPSVDRAHGQAALDGLREIPANVVPSLAVGIHTVVITGPASGTSNVVSATNGVLTGHIVAPTLNLPI